MHSIDKDGFQRRLLANAIAVSLAVAGSGSLFAQDAADDADVFSIESLTEEVIVTGFRRSLEQSLNLKRESVGSVDAIFAEDIGDFPDQNLAEALQRIPGITITRDSGEGRAISVRGLSGEFTRVRVNGIEAISTTGGEGGPNRSRDFDFNVFASELFNSVVVYKTASANLEEGSLGAVVDLNTGKPFNYAEGMTLVANAQAQYNDLSEDTGPRVAALFAYNDADAGWGTSFSLAYSDTTTVELGQNTVRWAAAPFRSVNGVTCASNPTNAGCAQVAGGFHPRIPRYGEIKLERERLGLTGAFQWAPTDRTEVSLDVLYSELDASRGEIWGEVLFRGNERFMDVTEYTYDPATNNVNSMTVNNAWVRNENFEKAWTTEFYQWGLNFDHDFSDTVKAHALVGSSSSALNFPYEITFVYDDRDYNGFTYDYTNDQFPVIAFNGPDVTDASNFQLAEFRDRPATVDNDMDVYVADVTWQFADRYSAQFGFEYKEYGFKTDGYIRDSVVCPTHYDCDQDNNGVNELVGVPGTDALSDIYHFDDRTGAGSTTHYAVPNLQAWIEFFDLFNKPLRNDTGNIRDVEEKDTSLFAQLNGDLDFGAMPFRFDIGGRWVETDQASSGFNSGVYVTVDREPYDDFLPAANAALFVTDELVLRASAAQVMTRPGLGSLTPGGSIDAFNYRITSGNPNLDPTRADAYDLGAEWYFAEEAVLSLALFYKDIESRPIQTQIQGTYASTGLPLDLLNPTSPAGQCPECVPWTISTTDNGPGGDLQGFEIGFQLPFSTFTDASILSNFGVLANYTNVDSDVDYTFGSTVVTERLFGLSEEAYNATLFWEREAFQARISWAYRSDWLTGTSDTGNRFEGYGPTSNVDFSSSWGMTEHFDLTFEALNLTDDYQDRWNDLATQRRYEYDHTGRVYILGLRYSN